jgi:hypothetical protein
MDNTMKTERINSSKSRAIFGSFPQWMVSLPAEAAEVFMVPTTGWPAPNPHM